MLKSKKANGQKKEQAAIGYEWGSGGLSLKSLRALAIFVSLA